MAGYEIDEATYRCADALPQPLDLSSRDAGWTSLLLDQHRGGGVQEAFTTRSTCDRKLIVSLESGFELDIKVDGRWRRTQHEPGVVRLAPDGSGGAVRLWRASGGRVFRSVHLYLPGQLVHDAADELRRAGRPARLPDAPVIKPDVAVTALVRSLVNQVDQGAPDLYAQAAAHWLAMHLVMDFARPACRAPALLPGPLGDRRVARVIEFMAAGLGEPLTLDDLAAEACVSPFHFIRLFKQKTGRTPVAYLTRLRMEHARHLLTTTDQAVAGVARLCGYASPSRFTAAFVAHCGATPSDLRRAALGASADAVRAPSTTRKRRHTSCASTS